MHAYTGFQTPSVSFAFAWVKGIPASMAVIVGHLIIKYLIWDGCYHVISHQNDEQTELFRLERSGGKHHPPNGTMSRDLTAARAELFAGQNTC